ncbi:MAG: M20/M25/M40 family metallo-hydrolase [Bacteroidales bacterium]
MKKLLLFLLICVRFNSLLAQDTDSLVIKNIYSEALSNNTAYKNMEYLCTKIGGRICGSPQAAAAIEWSKQIMQGMNLDTVYTQKIMVHHWVRGDKEYASMSSKVYGFKEVNVCALGESIGTPTDGIIAEVIEVGNFDQLKKLGKKQLTGKIVFFNREMAPKDYNTFEAYGGAVDQRVHGAAEAAKYGALAVIVRSLTLKDDYTTHTGIMRYDTNGTKIPAVAISTKDAELLSEWLKNDYELLFHLKTNSKMLPDVESYNVIGEIKGSEFPNEIITVGGHIDAWDNGQGAHDDGVGCMHSIEVLRILKELKMHPKHTIRVVIFMDEEVAQKGGKKYAAIVKEKKEKHLAAIESDEGGFTPIGFTIDASADTVAKISKWKDLLLSYGIYLFHKGYGGVDIYYLKGLGFPLIGLMTDSQKYFDYQHSESDTFDNVNKREMQLGSAAITSLVYLIDKYGIK